MVYYGVTDVGLKRENNQDVFYTHKFNNDVGFAAVCDGMGGHNCGNIASATACDAIAGLLINYDFFEKSKEDIQKEIIAAFKFANKTVYDMAQKDETKFGMGTTAVVAVYAYKAWYIAHVGDSRAYLIENDEIKQITKDHSRVQELFEQGMITKEEQRTHPDKNKITRAIGVCDDVDVDIQCFEYKSGQKILLCSDGLSNMLTDSEIYNIIKSNTAPTACEKLVEAANSAGGSDNITVAIIE